MGGLDASPYFCSLELIGPGKHLQTSDGLHTGKRGNPWKSMLLLNPGSKHTTVSAPYAYCGVWGFFSLDQTRPDISLAMVGLLPWNTHILSKDVSIQFFPMSN